MRRITCFLLILSLAATLMAQTELYKRFASHSDIRVASVSNFVLDSGITADVTLLEAVEDSTWQWLCREFDLAELSTDQQQQMKEGWDVVLFAQRDRNNPRLPAPIVNEQVDQSNSCYVGVSYLNRTLYIFCCNNNRQSDVIIDYLIEKMRHSIHKK